ncbi:hypothetical protein CTRU02_213459 [Colletotrichum truncatum]|uniref:Uncharacterized protein n=1 Tax=Colletotrichum truncatum TaxID=5467 RepID=A0ACC3YKS2_COLTU
MGERTGSRVLQWVWPYVQVQGHTTIYVTMGEQQHRPDLKLVQASKPLLASIQTSFIAFCRFLIDYNHFLFN